MSAQLSAVWDALSEVRDPCSEQLGRPMDVVTMGLVEDVSLEGGVAQVELLLTDASCIFFFKFSDEIERRLSALDGVDSVEVTLNETRLWSPDRIAATHRNGAASGAHATSAGGPSRDKEQDR